MEQGNYRDGTDLILSIGGHALGHSTECKISYKAETGTRKTKEARMGKYNEKYVKTLGVSITSSGFVFDGDSNNGLPTLKAAFRTAQPVTASWGYRDDNTVEQGQFVIASLDQEGKAGDDETYSISLENSGVVEEVTLNENPGNGEVS